MPETDVVTITDLLASAKIMVVGMGVVFAFLVFMIYFLKLQGWFLSRYFPEKAAAAKPSGGADDKLEGERLNKVLLAAIDEYRKKH